MYKNLAGHELVRQMRTWFETYVQAVSPMSWFIDKLQGELSQFRAVLTMRGQPPSPEAERLAFKIVERDVLRGRQPQAMANLEAFMHFQGNQVLCQDNFAQSPVFQIGETFGQLEAAVSQSHGEGLVWSFRG